MYSFMSKGRVPKKSPEQKPSKPEGPVSADRARKMILEHRAYEGMRVLGHLDLSGQPNLYELPEGLTCESLDISDCVNLTALPKGLHVTYWIEVAGCGITGLPSGHGFSLLWRGVSVTDRIAFEPQSMTGQDILQLDNAELRRVMIERIGYETFIEQVGGLVKDKDSDPGGDRQLIQVPFDDDEPLMVLKVTCPSTGRIYVLRVPPYMRSCKQAAAWTAGFDNPNEYQPLVEA
jgi:hypothetical protein